MTDYLMHEKLIADLAESDRAVPAGEQAIRDFTAACERAESDPREQRRIRDIIDLIEAEDVIYDQALATIDRGDHAAAVPLLRRCADAGIGESAWLLAVALEETGDVAEALTWYARAASDGDQRAADRLAEQLAPLPGSPAAGQSAPSSSDRLWVATGSGKALLTLAFARDTTAGHLGRWDAMLEAAARYPTAPFRFSSLCGACQDEDSSDGALWLDDAKVLLVQVKHYTRQTWADHWRQAPEERPIQCSWLGREDIARLKRRLAARVTASAGESSSWLAYEDTVTSLLREIECPAWGPVPLLRPGQPWAPRVIGGGLTAGDIMLSLPEVPAFTPDATVHEALERMLRSGAGAAPVREDGQVVGVIALADLAQRVYRTPGMPSIQRVGTLMRPPVTVATGLPVAEAMAAAADDRAGLLVVIQPDGTPVGYLTPEALLASGPTGDGLRRRPRADRDGRHPGPPRSPAGLVLAGAD